MCCLFFFFKQKTAYEMRISDWSSDVCSSDLVADDLLGAAVGFRRGRDRIHLGGIDEVHALLESVVHLRKRFVLAVLHAPGHAAEAEQADLQVAAAEPAIFHVTSFSSPIPSTEDPRRKASRRRGRWHGRDR